MNLNYETEDEQFRETVRAFLNEKLPEDLRHKVLNHLRMSKEDFVRWHKIVHAQGWAGASWRKEYGGTGWTAVQQHIWSEECAAAGAPVIQPFGINMVGPVIMAFGNEAQKAQYLPRILSCDDWWCQGFSEPGAGSDLASLSTRAERVGDHYVVNGQKTWTTLAQHADLMFCLARTDPNVRKQQGISFLLIDMKSPGITVRPIIMLDGEHEVNEVFFEDVQVPVENLVGEENKGWTYAKYLLGHERTSIAAVGRSKRELAFLKQLALQPRNAGKRLMDDPFFAAKLASIEIQLMALEVMVLRILSNDGHDQGNGPEASILKIKGTDVQQGLTDLMVEAIGPYAAPFDEDYLEGRRLQSMSGDDDAAPLAGYYLNYRKTAIYGGSTEVQKSIIARSILQL